MGDRSGQSSLDTCADPSRMFNYDFLTSALLLDVRPLSV
jgi:hypothetical protein